MAYNETKLRELVLYLARAQNDDYTFGRVKLAKLLYYSDMEAYVRLGASITGATYIKRQEGPAAREFVPVRDQMLAYGEAAEVEIVYPGGQVAKKLEARREPDVSHFSEAELAIADKVVVDFAGWSGTRISLKSHDEIGWLVARMDEVIPYQRYYVAPEMSSGERAKAEEIVTRLNLTSMAGAA